MSNTIIKPKDRAEWLTHRQSGIGSSEVATIVGLNPWETPYQLWRRKMGMDDAKTETFAMKAGHYLEDAVSQFWADETGREVIKSSAGDWLIVDDDKPFMRVSPDRIFWLQGEKRNNSNKGILECKTTQMTIDEYDIPKHWFVQVQYQLGVAGYTQGSLAWLSAGRNFGYKDLAFVPDFYGWLTEEVEKFWIDNIIGKVEPQVNNVADILLKFNKHTDGKILEVDETLFNSWTELKEVRSQIKALEEKETSLSESLKFAFEDAEAISYGGQTLATWKSSKPSSKFDAKAFQTANPELAKQYTVETAGTRRFLLK